MTGRVAQGNGPGNVEAAVMGGKDALRMAAKDTARRQLRLVIGIASAGRAASLVEAVAQLHTPDMPDLPIIVCVPSADNAAGLAETARLQILVGPSGLTRQRNAILSACFGEADVVLFLDDDFVPHPGFASAMQRVFRDDPEIVIATGRVLADGILGQAIDMADALHLLQQEQAQPGAGADANPARSIYNAYGCNMAVRLSTAEAQGIRFDEALPLYGWLEDVDFSRAMARHGRCVQVPDALGVHLGVRTGRQPGRRLGYSQLANPCRMMRKGTLSPRRGLWQIGRNLLANLVGSVRRQAEVDRRGRLAGNLLALGDLMKGRLDPGRILDLDADRQPASQGPAHPPAIQGSRS